MHRRLSIITSQLQSWRLIFFFLNYPFGRVPVAPDPVAPDRLVHTNTGVMVAALAAKLAGVPHIWHIRDWFQEFQSFWPAFSRYIRIFSQRIVAVSNAVAGQFEPPAIVIHDGFSLEEFQLPKQSLRQEFQSRYGLKGDFVVGCVGASRRCARARRF
jgi:hypothetical protein